MVIGNLKTSGDDNKYIAGLKKNKNIAITGGSIIIAISLFLFYADFGIIRKTKFSFWGGAPPS